MSDGARNPDVRYVQRTAFSQRPHFFKPTHAFSLDTQEEWRSRDHRKGRHRHPQGMTFWQKVLRLGQPAFWNLSWWIAFVSLVVSHSPKHRTLTNNSSGFHDWVCCMVHQWILRVLAFRQNICRNQRKCNRLDWLVGCDHFLLRGVARGYRSVD